MAEVTRRSAFWLLATGFVAVTLILSLIVIFIFR